LLRFSDPDPLTAIALKFYLFTLQMYGFER